MSSALSQPVRRLQLRLWGIPAVAWIPVAVLFCLDSYRVVVGQLRGDDQPTQMINIQIVIHRLHELDIVGAAKVFGLIEDPPLRYLLALPGQALFPHTVWGPRLGALVVSVFATYALIQLAREVAGDIAGWVTGLVVAASALYTMTTTTFGYSLIVLGITQALRNLRGPLDLSLPGVGRRFYRVQIWLGVAFLTSTATLPFAAMAFVIFAWANLPRRRLIARTFAAPLGGYLLYHLVFFAVVPLLGRFVYGKTHTFGQYGHLFSRNGASAVTVQSFLADLRGLNGQFLPFVSWVMLAAAFVYLWRHERRVIALFLPYMLLWGFYFGTGTSGYFYVGFIPLIPFAVALAVSIARPRVVLVAGVAVAAATLAWTTSFFTVTYTPTSYPYGVMHRFYADPIYVPNIVEPFPAMARELDRLLPPGGLWVANINHSFGEFYANHDLANLGYGDPRGAGELGSAVAPLTAGRSGGCWRVHPDDPRIAIAITANRLCSDQYTRAIAFAHSPIHLYVLRARTTT